MDRFGPSVNCDECGDPQQAGSLEYCEECGNSLCKGCLSDHQCESDEDFDDDYIDDLDADADYIDEHLPKD